jgi:hypothetical protein
MGSRDAWRGYEDHQHPRAMMFLPLRGLVSPDPYREHLNQLDLAGVIMSMYAEHRHICSFERVNLYSSWLRYDTRRVRYLPEWVLPQFGFVQTVP